MTRISHAQARAMGLEKKKPKKPQRVSESKYHSRKVELDGNTFDSQKEAGRYAELKLLLRAGEILKIELQPEFVLQEGFRHNGKWHRPIAYRADFRITYPDGRQVVIDTKGFKTPEYRLKLKLLLKRYPEIEFREE